MPCELYASQAGSEATAAKTRPRPGRSRLGVFAEVEGVVEHGEDPSWNLLIHLRGPHVKRRPGEDARGHERRGELLRKHLAVVGAFRQYGGTGRGVSDQRRCTGRGVSA